MIKARTLLLTIASVMTSALARARLGQIAPDISPFATYPAVALAGLRWGLGSAVLALLCSTAVAWWAFLHVYRSCPERGLIEYGEDKMASAPGRPQGPLKRSHDWSLLLTRQ